MTARCPFCWLAIIRTVNNKCTISGAANWTAAGSAGHYTGSSILDFLWPHFVLYGFYKPQYWNLIFNKFKLDPGESTGTPQVVVSVKWTLSTLWQVRFLGFTRSFRWLLSALVSTFLACRLIELFTILHLLYGKVCLLSFRAVIINYVSKVCFCFLPVCFFRSGQSGLLPTTKELQIVK